MKTYLIFGGTGFLGACLTNFLLTQGHRVIVQSRNPLGFSHEFLINFVSNSQDLEDLKSLIGIYAIEDAFYLVNTVQAHLIGQIDFSKNLRVHQSYLEFLFQSVGRVIFMSSGGRVYGFSDERFNEGDQLNPTCAYGKEKVSLEHLVLELSSRFQKKHLILRPANPYGPGQNIYGHQGFIAILFGKYFKGDTVELWNRGFEMRDYIYIDDFLLMVYNLICFKDLPFSVYNLGTGIGTTSLDIVSAIEQTTGHSVKRIFKEPGSASSGHAVLDISRYLDLFPRSKFISIPSGVERFYNWFVG